MWSWLKQLLARREPRSSSAPEADVADDPAQVRARPTGGGPREDGGDSQASTGPGETGTFVGRAAGQDVGYAGETGAERRGDK